MKKLMLILALLLLPAPVMAGPVLEMPSRLLVLDRPFGEGEEARIVFSVSNAGDSELKIIQVASGCGCITCNYDRSISPDCQGRIEFVIDTAGLAGRVRKRALVKTNDPQKEVFMVEMEINVLPASN